MKSNKFILYKRMSKPKYSYVSKPERIPIMKLSSLRRYYVKQIEKFNEKLKNEELKENETTLYNAKIEHFKDRIKGLDEKINEKINEIKEV